MVASENEQPSPAKARVEAKRPGSGQKGAPSSKQARQATSSWNADEFQQSNATANAMLGTRRHSWMNRAPAPASASNTASSQATGKRPRRAGSRSRRSLVLRETRPMPTAAGASEDSLPPASTRPPDDTQDATKQTKEAQSVQPNASESDANRVASKIHEEQRRLSGMGSREYSPKSQTATQTSPQSPQAANRATCNSNECPVPAQNQVSADADEPDTWTIASGRPGHDAALDEAVRALAAHLQSSSSPEEKELSSSVRSPPAIAPSLDGDQVVSGSRDGPGETLDPLRVREASANAKLEDASARESSSESRDEIAPFGTLSAASDQGEEQPPPTDASNAQALHYTPLNPTLNGPTTGTSGLQSGIAARPAAEMSGTTEVPHSDIGNTRNQRYSVGGSQSHIISSNAVFLPPSVTSTSPASSADLLLTHLGTVTANPVSQDYSSLGKALSTFNGFVQWPSEIGGPPQVSTATTAQLPGTTPRWPAEQVSQSSSTPVLIQPRSQPSTLFDKAACLEVIDRLKFPNGPLGPPRPLRDAERSRLQLFQAAFEQEDDLYIHIHQFYCHASLDLTSLDPSIKAMKGLREAIQILDSLLLQNSELSASVLYWFAKTKFPINALVDFPRKYRENVRKLANFISLSSLNYARLRQYCTQNRLIPLVDQMEIVLGITSPLLQEVTFTSFLRQSWCMSSGEQPNLTNQIAHQLFRKNQADWVLLKQSTTNPSVPRSNLMNYREWFNERFALLYRVRTNQASPAMLQTCDFNNSPINYVLPTGMSQTQVQSTDSALPNMAVPSHGNISHHQPYLSMAYGQTGIQDLSHTATAPSPVTATSFSTASVDQGQLSSLPRHVVPSSHRPYSPSLQPQQPLPVRHHVPFTPMSPAAQQHAQTGQPIVPSSPSPVVAPAPRNSMPLLPGPFFVRQQERVPHANRSSLHLAHLGSPTICALPHGGSEKAQGLFQYVAGLVMPPFTFEKNSDVLGSVPYEERTFTIPSSLFARIPKDVPNAYSKGAAGARNITTDSVQFRLRACKLTPQEVATFVNVQHKVRDDSLWVTKETSWPPHLFMEFNENSLEERRKIHFGRDLPCDITKFVKEGSNTLQVYVNRRPVREGFPDDPWPEGLYFVIEAVQACSKSKITKMINSDSQLIPAAQTFNELSTALPAGDDDDLCIVSSNLTISLLDPLLGAQIPGIPVKGRRCKHRECFDFDLFLESRPPLKRRPDEARGVDVWLCPICKGDARPKGLRKDEFMEHVLVRLRAVEGEKGKKVRSITVENDGTWRAKVEGGEDVVEKMSLETFRQSSKNNGPITPLAEKQFESGLADAMELDLAESAANEQLVPAPEQPDDPDDPVRRTSVISLISNSSDETDTADKPDASRQDSLSNHEPLSNSTRASGDVSTAVQMRMSEQDRRAIRGTGTVQVDQTMSEAFPFRTERLSLTPSKRYRAEEEEEDVEDEDDMPLDTRRKRMARKKMAGAS